MKNLIVLFFILISTSVYSFTEVATPIPLYDNNTVFVFTFQYNTTDASYHNMSSAYANYGGGHPMTGKITNNPFMGLNSAQEITSGSNGYLLLDDTAGSLSTSDNTYFVVNRNPTGSTNSTMISISYPYYQYGFDNSVANQGIIFYYNGTTHYLGNYDNTTEQNKWIALAFVYDHVAQIVYVYRDGVLIYTVTGCTTNLLAGGMFVGVAAAYVLLDFGYLEVDNVQRTTGPVYVIPQQTAVAAIASLTSYPTCIPTSAATNTPTPNATQTVAAQETQTSIAQTATQVAVALQTANAQNTVCAFTPTSTYTWTQTPTATPTPTWTPASYYAIACGDTNTAWAYGLTFTADNDSVWNYSSYTSYFHTPVLNTSYQQLWDFQNLNSSGNDITYTVKVGAGIRYNCYVLLSLFTGSPTLDISINGVPEITGLNIFAASGNQKYWAYTLGPYQCYDNGGNMAFDFHCSSGGVHSPNTFVNGIYMIAGAPTWTPTITVTITPTMAATLTSTNTQTITATPTVTQTNTPALYNYYINCGQPTATVVANGITWSIDQAYPGSPTLGSYGWYSSNPAVYVDTTNTAYPHTPYNAVFGDYSKSMGGSGSGSMVWGFDVPSGYYMITLSWVDWMSTAKGQNTQAVIVNGTAITGLTNLDVYATAGTGGLYQTVVVVHYTIGSSLQVGFYPLTGKSFVNAISVVSFDPNQVYIQHIKLGTAYPPGVILSQ